MAEVVAGIGAVLGSVGTAVVEGGTAVAGSLGSMATMETLVQGGTTALSLLSSMNGAGAISGGAATLGLTAPLQEALGQLEASRAMVDAEGIRLDTQLAGLDAERTVLGLRRDLLRKTGEARVAFAASGVDIASGTAALIPAELAKAVGQDINNIRFNQGLASKIGGVAADMTASGATAANITGTLNKLGILSQVNGLQSQAAGKQLEGVMTALNFVGDYLKRGV